MKIRIYKNTYNIKEPQIPLFNEEGIFNFKKWRGKGYCVFCKNVTIKVHQIGKDIIVSICDDCLLERLLGEIKNEKHTKV